MNERRANPYPVDAPMHGDFAIDAAAVLICITLICVCAGIALELVDWFAGVVS